MATRSGILSPPHPNPLPEGEGTRGPRLKTDAAIVAILVLGTISLYARTAHFDFVNLDDPPYVSLNKHVLGGFTADNIAWALTASWPSYWHPLTFLSLMLDAQLFGSKPGPMHIHNALLHAANAALLYWVLLRMTRARWPSAWVAAMFAWHPLRVESVAWITERKDVLSGLLLLLCVLSYIRYVRQKTRIWYVLMLATTLLGLMAKPILVVTPLLLLLLDIWPLDRHERLWELVREKIPIVLLAAACCAVTLIVQDGGHSSGPDPLAGRVANAIVSYGRYLRMTVVPRRLAVFYPLPTLFPGGHIPAWQVATSAAVIVLLSLIAAMSFRRAPAVLVGWVWYLIALLPVIGIVQSGEQSHADRFMYLPSIGLFIAVAFPIAAWIQRSRSVRIAIGVLGVLTVVSCVVASSRQIEYWRNTYSLMTHATAVVPNCYLAHRSMGEMYDNTGDVAAADREYHEALRLRPGDAASVRHLARHALLQGRDDDALKLFREAIFLDPRSSEDYDTYAELLAKTGAVEEAITVYRTAIKRSPRTKEFYHELALLLGSNDRTSEAIPLWDEALKIDPDYADAHASLGMALVMTGQTRRGISELERALKIQPDRTDALKSLAWTLATHPSPLYQNGSKAQTLARQAVDLTRRNDPIALDVLAAADARQGDFDSAQQNAESAAVLAEQQHNTELAAQIRKRIELYRARQPFTSGRQER